MYTTAVIWKDVFYILIKKKKCVSDNSKEIWLVELEMAFIFKRMPQ